MRHESHGVRDTGSRTEPFGSGAVADHLQADRFVDGFGDGGRQWYASDYSDERRKEWDVIDHGDADPGRVCQRVALRIDHSA